MPVALRSSARTSLIVSAGFSLLACRGGEVGDLVSGDLAADSLRQSASCRVEPATPAATQTYQLLALDLPHSRSLRVELRDAEGTRRFDRTSDANGRVALELVSNQAGAAQARIYDRQRASRLLTSCSFTVNAVIACGDGLCGSTESCALCPADCGSCPVCGDADCGGDETCADCALDCGECPPADPLPGCVSAADCDDGDPATRDLCSGGACSHQSGPLAVFPGADGGGAETPAGRGGQILKVTNLNDSGTGSLRAAVSAVGARIIVFEVSGTISLAADLRVANPFCTIAGQTAPSPGITLRGAGIRVTTHDVLVQHLRVRVGDALTGPDPTNRDAIQVLGPNAYNVVIDHNSLSWATDETLSTWYAVHDIVVSNNIIAEGLYNSIHVEKPHSTGILLGADANAITIKGNLLAHNNTRNPLIESNTSGALINNVFYDAGPWEFTAITGYTESTLGPSFLSLVGNVYKKGPNTTATTAIAVGSSVHPSTAIHAADNTLLPSGTVFSARGYGVAASPVALDGYTIMPNGQVLAAVTQHAGARPTDRDAVDARVVQETLAGTGRFVDSPSQVGGWPVLAVNLRPFPVPAAPHADDDGDGYTNVEELLHEMAAALEGR